MNRKTFFRILLVLLLAGVGYAVYYAWVSFPIISGYSAKNACSCIFLQNRSEEAVQKEELADFPLSLNSLEVDRKDSSVTARVWGLAKRKAVYRKGRGCTLVNDITEETLRAQTAFADPGNQVSSDSVDWPLGDRLPAAKPEGYNEKKGKEALDFVFAEPDPEHKIYTRAALVVYKGQIVAERYAAGFRPETPMLGWSMAKSFMNALVGMLVQQGRLDLTAPAPVPEWKDPSDRRHAITLEQLLQQTSGLDFVENYTKFSDVTNMLFNKGDMAGYAAARPLAHAPGTFFNYNGGNSNLLSRIVRQTVGEKEYFPFVQHALFRKLGMHTALLEPDASGTLVGSSYIYASARDYARFGLLYAQDGVWMNERLLPEGWVKKTATPSPANQLKNYGYQFWLNGLHKNKSGLTMYPDAPADLFLAEGFGGQCIYIIPSRQLVIVRLGLKNFDENGFLKRVLTSVP